jgi:predicted nucleic acid-binding protein
MLFMTDKLFVDTNILIYAYDTEAGNKHAVCKQKLRDLWDSGDGVISTQVMQEFYVNVTRKIAEPLSFSHARRIIKNYAVWQVELISPRLVGFASEIQERNQLSFWDALILATAIQGNVKILLSEDLNSGQLIEGVKVVNSLLHH